MESAGRGKFFFAVAPSGGKKGLFGKMAAVGQVRSREKRKKRQKIEQKKRQKIEEKQKRK